MAKKYTICDGKLVLNLVPDDGWYVVTSPMNPELVTQARTVEEAFEMGHDAMRALRRATRKWFKETQQPTVRAKRK